jgi:Flp pilus assembly protein TadB
MLIVRRLQMRDTTRVIEVMEVFFGTLGIGLVVFGVARGIHANEKLVFIPVGLALAALVFWNQRKRKKKGDKL